MGKKLRSRRGMTLAETLAALAVFAILSVVLLYGVTAAWKVYLKAVIASEARTLQSTIVQALSDELRYAENIRIEADDEVVFDSDVFGPGVSVISGEDGRIRVGVSTAANPYDLLGAKAYTSGLKAWAEIKYDAAGGLFTVTLTIKQDSFLTQGLVTELKIRALNASAESGAAFISSWDAAVNPNRRRIYGNLRSACKPSGESPWVRHGADGFFLEGAGRSGKRAERRSDSRRRFGAAYGGQYPCGHRVLRGTVLFGCAG